MSTEDNNFRTKDISNLDTKKMVETIHMEDIRAYEAVGCSLNQIASVIDKIFNRLNEGGRVFYVGAGTSGRIASQDVVELEPTYGIENLFFYIMAGGTDALSHSKEGAEDNKDEARKELERYNIGREDVIIGISASGRTPFVIEAIKFGNTLGSYTVGIANNSNSPLSLEAQDFIFLDTGEEVIQGSTRMKAGTAQKMTLNIISTSIAIKLGFTDGNIMTHMRAFYNEKLKKRAIKIIVQKTGLDEIKAKEVLEIVNYDIPKAIERIKSNTA